MSACPMMQLTIDGREEVVGRGDVREIGTPTGFCGCGCGEATSNLYVNKTHAQRAYRRRVKRAMEAAGLPASPSLSVARSMGATLAGNGDPQIGRNGAERRDRSGLQVSFAKAAAAVFHSLEAPLMASGFSNAGARETIENALRDALSARQRATLEAREGR